LRLVAVFQSVVIVAVARTTSQRLFVKTYIKHCQLMTSESASVELLKLQQYMDVIADTKLIVAAILNSKLWVS
jgi:hypothetical protein